MIDRLLDIFEKMPWDLQTLVDLFELTMIAYILRMFGVVGKGTE